MAFVLFVWVTLLLDFAADVHVDCYTLQLLVLVICLYRRILAHGPVPLRPGDILVLDVVFVHFRIIKHCLALDGTCYLCMSCILLVNCLELSSIFVD